MLLPQSKRSQMKQKHVSDIKSHKYSHPDVVEGVGCVSRVVHEAVSSIVTLREGHPELGVNVLHELSSIVHRLDNRYNLVLVLTLPERSTRADTSTITERCTWQCDLIMIQNQDFFFQTAVIKKQTNKKKPIKQQLFLLKRVIQTITVL